MNNLLKYGLIGAALYFVYRHFAQQPAAETTPTPATAAPAPAEADTAVWSQILTAATPDANYQAQGGLMSGYQWLYYWQHVRGIPPVIPASANWNLAENITFADFVSRAKSAGLSGLAGNFRRF